MADAACYVLSVRAVRMYPTAQAFWRTPGVKLLYTKSWRYGRAMSRGGEVVGTAVRVRPIKWDLDLWDWHEELMDQSKWDRVATAYRGLRCS